jgi:two-component system phosphate regulon sensor histidine kinase PhoR
LISKGEISLQKTEVDLAHIVEEEIKKGYFRMSDNLELLLSVEGTPRKIIADSLHVTNLISNLIDNAIKYSKGKPQIKIVLKYNKNIQIIVKDAGIGIPKEFIPKIFDNLFRVPTGNIHDVKGFGLGLTYVKAICDAHKWKIEVQSELGKGTTFHIQIKT